MATQRTNKGPGTRSMVYQGAAMQVQDTIRLPKRAMPSHKRAMWARCLSLGLLAALMLAGDGMPIKHPVCHERQAWQATSRIVVEQGLIWIMEDTDD